MGVFKRLPPEGPCPFHRPLGQVRERTDKCHLPPQAHCPPSSLGSWSHPQPCPHPHPHRLSYPWGALVGNQSETGEVGSWGAESFAPPCEEHCQLSLHQSTKLQLANLDVPSVLVGILLATGGRRPFGVAPFRYEAACAHNRISMCS